MAEGVEQLVGYRGDDLEIGFACTDEQPAMPHLCRGAQLGVLFGEQFPGCVPFQAHEVAHPDIMDEVFAVAERDDAAQNAFGRLVVGIVIGRCHALAVHRQTYIAKLEHRIAAVRIHVHQADGAGDWLC